MCADVRMTLVMSIKTEGRYKQAMCPVVYNELLMIAFSLLQDSVSTGPLGTVSSS